MKKITMIFCFAALFAACKKDGQELENGNLAATELVDYYIAGEIQHRQDPPILFCIHFENSGAGVQAISSNKNSNVGISPDVTIENNRIVLDFSGGYGESVYMFTLKKEEGKLSISSGSFAGIFPHEMPYSIITKKSGTVDFAGKTYRQIDNSNSYLKFTVDNKWDWSATNSFTRFNQSYQKTGNPVIGWTGSNHLGILLPLWKDIQSPVMVVENPNREIVLFKENN